MSAFFPDLIYVVDIFEWELNDILICRGHIMNAISGAYDYLR